MKQGKVRKIVEFDKETLDKIDELFPSVSHWYLINRLLACLVESYEDNPIDYAAIGARLLKKEMEGG